MIEIKNLYKIYKSKKKEECVAVNNVSLILEDKGLVFIIGKSGSGKTTLLSLIGGLDNISKGDIIVNGISFKSFKTPAENCSKQFASCGKVLRLLFSNL